MQRVIGSAGSSPCDSRRPLHITREHFPGIDFANIETDEDVQYERVQDQVNSRGEYRFGESEAATEQRGVKFLKWLMARCADNNSCASLTLGE